MIFARVYRTQTCILPIEYLVGHEGQPSQQVCSNTVLHCRGHKGLRLLIESYPPSVKVYPQVEKIKFSPLLLKLLLLFWHNQYIFSSLKCGKKKKIFFFWGKKKRWRNSLSLTTNDFWKVWFTLMKVGRVVVLAGGLQFKP